MGVFAVIGARTEGWDERNYHYYAGYCCLTGRSFVNIAASQIQSYFNPVVYVPFYWMASRCAPQITVFTFGCLHGLNIVALLRCLNNFLNSGRLATALKAACVLVAVIAPAFLVQFGSSGGDVITSVLVLFGLSLIWT
ncbi:MAG: hypothetical protein ACRD3W_05380, partial [Terriglobales bacterium]